MYYGVGGTFDQCPLRYVFAFVFVCNLRWVWFLTSSLLPSFVVLDKFNACDDFNIFFYCDSLKICFSGILWHMEIIFLPINPSPVLWLNGQFHAPQDLDVHMTRPCDLNLNWKGKIAKLLLCFFLLLFQIMTFYSLINSSHKPFLTRTWYFAASTHNQRIWKVSLFLSLI